MKSNDIQLGEWDELHAETLLKYANNPNIAGFMTDSFPHPYKIENAKAFIQFARSSETSKIKAILYKGEVVGSIGLHYQQDISRKNAELGYWLAEPFWGKGIMTEAVRQMLAWGFINMDVIRIFGKTFDNNRASQKVMEKAGLQLQARIEKGFYKNGEFHDELIYGIYQP